MTGFFEFIKQLLLQFQPWITVMPWERALRVRLGKHVRELSAGVYLRIPFIDIVFQQSVRLRCLTASCQTVTTRDGSTIYIGAQVNYALGDMHRLFETIQHVDGTIASLVQGALAAYISNHDLSECRPDVVAKQVTENLGLSNYGLTQVRIQLTDYAIAPTFRLLMDNRWSMGGDALNTSIPSNSQR